MDERLLDLLGDAAVLRRVAASADADAACLVWLRSPNPDAMDELAVLSAAYAGLFGADLGYVATHVDGNPREAAVRLEMPGVAPLLSAEQGTHLFGGWGRAAVVVQVIVTPSGDRDPAAVLAELRATDHAWRQAGTGPDPFPLEPVVRVYDAAGLTVDVRSGLAVRGLPSSADVRRALVARVRAMATS